MVEPRAAAKLGRGCVVGHVLKAPGSICRRETENHAMVIRRARIDACRGEFGLVGRIGEFLRFHRDAVALAIEMAVLADERAVDEVAGIALPSRPVRPHFAPSSAPGFLPPPGDISFPPPP